MSYTEQHYLSIDKEGITEKLTSIAGLTEEQKDDVTFWKGVYASEHYNLEIATSKIAELKGTIKEKDKKIQEKETTISKLLLEKIEERKEDKERIKEQAAYIRTLEDENQKLKAENADLNIRLQTDAQREALDLLQCFPDWAFTYIMRRLREGATVFDLTQEFKAKKFTSPMISILLDPNGMERADHKQYGDALLAGTTKTLLW